MARLLKILALIIGMLIILIVAAGLVLPMIIDVNDHKDRISLEIKDATGYEVIMEGDIELSLIPWIGLSLGRTHVANPPGFNDRPLASLDELQIRIRFWPLIAGRVEADNIVLRRLELALVRDEEGRENWIIPEDPEARPDPEPGIPPEEIDDRRVLVSPYISDLNIQSLRVTDSAVSFEDSHTGQAAHIRDLNLSTGTIILDAPFDFSANMNIESPDPELRGELELSALITIDSPIETIRLDNFLMNINAEGQLFATPLVNDTVRADILYELPGNALYLNNLEIDVYDGQLRGRISALNLDRIPDISFEMTGRNIDLDKIFGEAPMDSNQTEPPAGSAAAQGVTPEPPGTPLNLSFLSDFNIEGQIDLEEIITSGILIDSLTATISSGQGRMTISPLTARLYQGVQESNITLEDIGGVLHISAVQNLEGLQMGPFIQDLTGQDIITGTAAIHSDTKTWGQEHEAFVGNMSGTAFLSLSDGVIKGVDLERKIREVFALAAGEIGAAAENGGETGFTRMSAGFDVENGIAVSRDLTMSSPVLGLEGEMTADLPRSRLESRSRISLDGALREELMARYNIREVTIPLRVRGPFDDLSFGIDSETLVRSLVRERGEDELRKLLDRLGPADKEELREEKPPGGVEDLLRRMIPGS